MGIVALAEMVAAYRATFEVTRTPERQETDLAREDQRREASASEEAR